MDPSSTSPIRETDTNETSEAYRLAEEKIAEALRSGAKSLDLKVEWNEESKKLTALPASLAELVHLYSLNLSGHRLTTLPDWLRNFTELRFLDLIDNPLKQLPDWIGNLTSLQSLDFAHAKVTDLPDSIRELQSLEVLNLYGNPLKAVPNWIGELTQLTGLQLGGLGLPEFPGFVRMLKRLNWLRIHNNDLSELPAWIEELEDLYSLDLENNKIDALPDSFGNLRNLGALEFGEYRSGNPLKVLPSCIRRLTKLTILNAAYCQLSEIPEWIGELPDLSELRVNNNHLTALPLSVSKLDKLKELDISHNPLSPGLAAANKEGVDAVRRYLQELAKGARDRYEAKLLILGDGNEGKTCVSRAIRNLPFQPQVTTRGVDVEQWTFDHPNFPADAAKRITLNIWDFEGQEISHQTHQFFLTSQSLYLLVFKCRDLFLMERAEYWIDTIRARAPQAKVVIVISQCEGRSPHVPLDKIEAQYGDMLANQWFFAVGCEDGKNITKLQAFLQQSAANLEFMGAPWPKSYDRAEQKLKAKAKTRTAYINRARLQNILGTAGVDVDSYDGAAVSLSRLGVITQFLDCADLRDFVVLKPQWLTKAISMVMEDGKLSEDKGEIALQRMEQIWTRAGYAGMFATFHNCMKEFELCYDLEDQTRSCLVPLRFGYIAPTIPWSLNEAKERRMQYKLHIRPPMGLMSRFIVKVHHMIVRTLEYPKGIYWHNGVFLRTTSPFPSEALCEFVPDDRIFQVQVRAAFPQNMCEQIHGYLQALFSFFGGLTAERSYGCIKADLNSGGEQQCSGLHTEKRIYTAISKGRETFDCEFEEHEVDPRILVGGLTSFNDFVLKRVTATLREEMDRPPAWAAPFLGGISALLDWVRSNSGKLDQVLQGQTALAAEFKQEAELRLHEYLNCMSIMLDDRDHTAAPGLISIMTKDRSPWNPAGFFQKTYTLTPYCESEGNIHSCDDGTVEFTRDRAWWQKTAPWVARGTKLLTAGLQLAFAGMPLALGHDAAKAIEDQVKLMNELTKHLELEIPEENVDDGSVKVIEGAIGKDLRGNDQETVLTRSALARFLEDIAPDNYRARRWGSLHRVKMPDNSYRWLCEAHAS